MVHYPTRTQVRTQATMIVTLEERYARIKEINDQVVW